MQLTEHFSLDELTITGNVGLLPANRAIVANGEALLGWKWQKEVEIASCTTIDQLDAVVF